ncbi:glycerol-3-phosphate responsive antiterminator [Enterococcus sp. DIV0756]|uniref:glycerol-3-phosphate responsive antiterminator n=1 Tax=Enterococcus sp. DIV0756 TaxID=2774636 RepID=UPI003F23CAEB
MKRKIIQMMEDNPLIAAINNKRSFEKALTCESDIIFVLYGDVCSIVDIVDRLKEAGKIVMVDVDLIDGLATKETAVDYLKRATKADGIISSKSILLRAANARGLFTIHRFFLIDSKSFHNLPKQLGTSKADVVEVLPGAMPKVLSWVQDVVDVPIIASGLVCDKELVMTALQAGAVAISTTNMDVWDI